MLERYSVLDGRIAHSDAGTIPVDVYVMPDGEERAYLTDENKCGIGDKVKVMETRPLSKDKRWRLVEIIEKAK